MKQAFLNAHQLLRFLTDDEPATADRVATLLDEAAQGRLTLLTAEVVVTEVVWTLEAAYALVRSEIAPLVRGILAAPGLEVLNRDLIARAVEIYETGRDDFVDAYQAAIMEREQFSARGEGKIDGG